ncbi:hypothetical protein [Moorella sp. ACPs]|uniref:hypothetical protein n=1 Tax=Neomoorella carbonis TaxID=3062783 RepID=UPI00387382EB
MIALLKNMAGRGRPVVFISHKLNEVMAVSDRVTVLRDGRVVAVRKTCATSPQELARLMVGRDMTPPAARRRRPPHGRGRSRRTLFRTADGRHPAGGFLSFCLRRTLNAVKGPKRVSGCWPGNRSTAFLLYPQTDVRG